MQGAAGALDLGTREAATHGERIHERLGSARAPWMDSPLRRGRLLLGHVLPLAQS